MVRVSGLLAPAESRPAQGAPVPVNVPGASTNLLSADSGWQVGGTSSEVGEARTRWIAAAVKSGLSAGQFVVVEWGYRKVVARKKRSG